MFPNDRLKSRFSHLLTPFTPLFLCACQAILFPIPFDFVRTISYLTHLPCQVTLVIHAPEHVYVFLSFFPSLLQLRLVFNNLQHPISPHPINEVEACECY